MKVRQLTKKLGFLYELKTKKALFILMLPGLLYLFVNNYIPMIGATIAFKRITYGNNFIDTYIKSPYAGLKNFEFFIKTSYAWIITRNTVLFNLAFIIIGLVLAVTVAICLNELTSSKLFRFYQSVMIMPNFLSWIVIAIIVYAFVADTGLVNTVLIKFGMKESIQFFSEPKYWIFIIIAVQVWVYLGTSAVIYYATLSGINPELYESAMMDGASKWQQTRTITLPMLRPTIFFMVMVSLGQLFVSNFGLFWNVPQETGALFDVTNVIDTYVFRALHQTGDIEMAAAASFYQSIVGFIIVMISNSIIRIVSKEDAVF
jgi:putative aldouronate transport system permease protein